MKRAVSGLCSAVLLGLAACGDAPGADDAPIRIVGSSTVYPFTVLAAERFSDETGIAVIVEQTGSGGGHKLFCAADSRVQATTASRARMPEEGALCDANGRSNVLELPLGYDRIQLAQSAEARDIPLDPGTLWRALAAELPDAECRFAPNPNAAWSDVDDALPDRRIRVHGPPPTSGTRDTFVALALTPGALTEPCMARLAASDPGRFARRVATLRTDGAWIDAGENDAALLRRLEEDPATLGVLGQPALVRAGDRVRPVAVRGAGPMTRTLYLYIDADASPAVREFARTLTQPEASGPGGYLGRAGLLPLSASEQHAVARRLDKAVKD